MPAFLASPLAKVGAITLIAALLMGAAAWLLRDQFAEGKKAGAAAVTNAVQSETLNTVRKAQERKDQVDDEVSKTPYKDAVDRLD
ncbi:hypothetical protein [Reyranella sp.]|uniref:hypothetical protein n=1 Tax=Reyranella sp. TaxID=1929291 RepID=UPI003C79E2E2